MPTAPTFFRNDGWVKSVIGNAVPGAQVFICQQPANQTFSPTPLQSIFSDPNGVIPITQPMITDGFGHYDFYVTPGTYTVLVYLNANLQQVYPDQTIGLSSSAGTTLTIETNGAVASNQSLLNLTDSTNITWANVNGVVKATATGIPSAITLKTNGVSNTSQTVLNLKAGTNMTLTADGVGGVTLDSSGGSFSTPNIGAFYGAGSNIPYGANVTAGKVGDAVQRVYAFSFVLQSAWTITTASYMSDNSAGSAYFGFGIYNSSGTAVLTTSFLSTDIGGNIVQTKTFGSVSLPAGVYYFAQAVDNAALVAPVFALSYSGQPAEAMLPLMNANSQSVAMLAANSMGVNTGIMPSTLGALTPLTTSGQGAIGIAVVKFTP